MGGIIVIKCGGSMIDSLSHEFYQSIKTLKDNGLKPIIVHGGGPEINKLLTAMQIETEFVNGLRKTTQDVMNVVEMVLSGTLTNKLVRELKKHEITALGLTGTDGSLMQAEAKDLENLGFVGEITKINSELLLNLLALDLVPVISPIAEGIDEADCYNINADTAAAAIAVAVQADKLLFVTDVPGILHSDRLIEATTNHEILQLIDDGIISGGMIPKVMAAIDSLEGGMDEVMIVSGYANLLEGTSIAGTTIRKGGHDIK